MLVAYSSTSQPRSSINPLQDWASGFRSRASLPANHKRGIFVGIHRHDQFNGHWLDEISGSVTISPYLPPSFNVIQFFVIRGLTTEFIQLHRYSKSGRRMDFVFFFFSLVADQFLSLDLFAQKELEGTLVVKGRNIFVLEILNLAIGNLQATCPPRLQSSDWPRSGRQPEHDPSTGS